MKINELFGWKKEIQGDIDTSVFAEEVDPRKVGWDLAIWGNEWLAKWARDHKENKSDISVVPGDWLRAMTTSPDLFVYLVSRVPYTVARAAELLKMGSGHLIKAVNKGGSASSAQFAAYLPERGIWVQGTNEVYSLLLKVQATDFAEAMNRAADLAEHLADQVLTRPIKPAATASASDKAAYERDLAVYKALYSKVKRAKDFDVSLTKTVTLESMRSLWRGLVMHPQEDWDSDMRWIVLRDCALDLDAVMDSHGKQVWDREPFDVAHSPAHMSTMSLDVAWKEYQSGAGIDVDSSEWYLGVARALPDPEIRKYLQKRFGAALLGKPGAVSKSMVWQYGPSGAAKSTIQEIIAGAGGVLAPYSYVASSSVLTDKGAAKGKTDLFKAYARGKRIVLMDEFRRGSLIMEDELKTLTGGNTVEGTAKYANSVSYDFTATIFLASNDPPTVASGDKVAAARIHVVPFLHVFYLKDDRPEEWAVAPEEHRADPGWKDRVLGSESERTMVLAWVLDGLLEYAAEGIGDLPEATKEARDEFQEDGKGLAERLLDYMLTGGEYERPWIRIMTDVEWKDSGLMERDGLSTERFRTLLAFAGAASGLTDGKLSTRLENDIVANLNQMGGKKKKVAINEKRLYAFSRVREESAVTGMFTSV